MQARAAHEITINGVGCGWVEQQSAREVAAELEAHRFLKRLVEIRKARDNDPGGTHPKECGALRRASMDLTRALADLRRPL